MAPPQSAIAQPSASIGFAQAQPTFGAPLAQSSFSNGAFVSAPAQFQTQTGAFPPQQVVGQNSFGQAQQTPAFFGAAAGSTNSNFVIPNHMQANGFGGNHLPVMQQQNGALPDQPQSQSHFGLPPAAPTNAPGSGPTRPRPDNVTNDFAAQQVSNSNTRASPLPNMDGDVSTYTTRDAGNRLLTWKGRTVRYLEGSVPHYQLDDRSWERIWFPDGPPLPTESNSMREVDYSAEDVAAFQLLREANAFRTGLVPETAPRLDMVRFDC